MSSNLSLLGQFLKTHGISGHLLLKLLSDGEFGLKEGDPVFVIIDGIPVPFFISQIRFQSDETALILFDEIESSDDASFFAGKTVLVDREPVYRDEGPQDPAENFQRLEGFAVIDENRGETGILESVVSLPGNPVMRIEKDGREILVPFHEDIIKKIDFDVRTIYIFAPDGLLDLYL